MNPTSNDEQATKSWYRSYYNRYGVNRNDLISNPEVMFQLFATKRSFIMSLRRIKLERSGAAVLDVGCGDGAGLAELLSYGFSGKNLNGIDINPERVEVGLQKYPNLGIALGDASRLPFDSDRFDLVYESTMFVQVTDLTMSQAIASEMLRVAKPFGYIILVDWRYGKPWNTSYLECSRSRVEKLFRVGLKTEFVCINAGAIIPPLGRLISRYIPSCYFLVSSLFPFLVGQVSYVLRKC
jgi:ubiquinone/menaquinone biosynthesis C-methylase UbiE